VICFAQDDEFLFVALTKQEFFGAKFFYGIAYFVGNFVSLLRAVERVGRLW